MTDGVGDGPGDQAPENDWRNSVPETYRDMGIVKASPDAETFFKRVNDLEKYQGKSVLLPSDDAGEEKRLEARDKILKHFEKDVMLRPDFENEEQSKAFYQTMGMPEEPSGYQVPEVEGISIAEDREAELRRIAHEAGLTGKQFNVMIQKGLELDIRAMENMRKQTEEGAAGLKADWGQAYEDRTQAVKQFVQDRLPSLNSDSLPPQAMKELWEVAKEAYSGKPQIDRQKIISDQLSPLEARSKIAELRGNREFMKSYMDRSSPDHQINRDRMAKYYKAAYPGDEEEAHVTTGIG